MLKQICAKTSEIILSVLSSQTEIKDNAVCNPVQYFNTIYRLQAGVLGIVAGRELHPNSVFLEAVNECSIEERDALKLFKNWFSEQSFEKVNLSDLYELMLLLEFPVRDGRVTADAENLNSIGSFYTPTDLADKIVELTLNNYILQRLGISGFPTAERKEDELVLVRKLFMNSTFADYSCGSGSFLLAILRFCKTHFSISNQDLKSIALNFHAIEADSLSLEIAKIQVLEAIDDFTLYSEISTKFIHGNPLIAPNEAYPQFEFCPEFYYHNDLALASGQIEKCDVVVGNPPWGTVGFDLQHYFHLLCPELNEIEDEVELENALESLSQTHPNLHCWLLNHDETVDLAMEDIYNDERFEHSAMGGLHTNVLFTELCDSLCAEKGSVGLVLKGSTLSDSINKRLIHHLASRKRIQARYDFLNTNTIFNIGQDEEFSILILGTNGLEPPHKTNITQLAEL